MEQPTTTATNLASSDGAGWDIDSMLNTLSEEQLYSSFLDLSPGQASELQTPTASFFTSSPTQTTDGLALNEMEGFETLPGIVSLPSFDNTFLSDNNNVASSDNSAISSPSEQLTFAQPFVGQTLQLVEQPIKTEPSPSQSQPQKKRTSVPVPTQTSASNKKQKLNTNNNSNLRQDTAKVNTTNNSVSRTTIAAPTRTGSKLKYEDEKYAKRLEANKKSAQASRERKKALKAELEQKVSALSTENGDLSTTITELETENKVLKAEFLHLQSLVNENPLLLKLMAKANMSLLPESYYHAIENPTRLSPGASTNAFWYLMVVLYTFSQYFQSLPNGALPNINAALAAPIPPVVVH